MLQDTAPGAYYVVLGGGNPRIERLYPQLEEDDKTTVVVKVYNHSTADHLSRYQRYFQSGNPVQIAQGVACAEDYEGAFYPVCEGTIDGKRIRMIFSDYEDTKPLLLSQARRKYQRVDSFSDAIKYMLAGGDRQLIKTYGVTPWVVSKKKVTGHAFKGKTLSIPGAALGGLPKAPLTQNSAHAPTTVARATQSPRKQHTCSVCSNPMAGHPKSSKCDQVRRARKMRPAEDISIDKLVALTKDLELTSSTTDEVAPFLYVQQDDQLSSTTSTDEVALSNVKQDNQSSWGAAALAHSALMIALGASVTFAYLSL